MDGRPLSSSELSTHKATAVEHAQVVIIGAGFSGLAAAIQLRKAGYQDILILERASSVGGTWRDNDYPGAACDIPSHLYSLSFAPNPSWSSTYSNQREIQAYLESIAARFDLHESIRFGHNVESLEYHTPTCKWHIKSAQGNVTADFVWACQGGLSHPRLPTIPGQDTFSGPRFHSSRWDHSVDLKGKRIAVIGTGASAIQFVPEIAKQAARVDLYQRTPPWIIPRMERRYTEEERTRFRRFDVLRLAHRWRIYWELEMRGAGLLGRERMTRFAAKIARKHLRDAVKDPELRRALTPRYTLGCKRILLSNDYYPCLTQSHVHLHTSKIKKIQGDTVHTEDQAEHPADILIYATGFYTTDNPTLASARGTTGGSLGELWATGEKAYWGTMVPGFPNFFMIVGPNTGLGHNSQIFMIESQIAYAIRILKYATKNSARSVEVSQEATERYDSKIQEKMKGTVWKSGCESWYQSKNQDGRISAIWPGWTFEFWARTLRIDKSAFILND